MKIATYNINGVNARIPSYYAGEGRIELIELLTNKVKVDFQLPE